MVLALALVACSGDSDETTMSADTGTPPTSAEVEDVFVQTLLSPVDVLWVFDTNWTDGYESIVATRQDTIYETLLLHDPEWQMGFMSANWELVTQRGVIRGVHNTVFPDPGTWELPPKSTDSRRSGFDLHRPDRTA